MCFNGAATVRSRKPGKSRLIGGRCERFNGAATVRSRKPSQILGNPYTPYLLQWGRDRPVAETSGVATSASLDVTALQWGRDRPVAETGTTIGPPLPSSMSRLQWGRDRPVAETPAGTRIAVAPWAWLQWGRDRPVAETQPAPGRPRSQERPASMGPRPSGRGNPTVWMWT